MIQKPHSDLNWLLFHAFRTNTFLKLFWKHKNVWLLWRFDEHAGIWSYTMVERLFSSRSTIHIENVTWTKKKTSIVVFSNKLRSWIWKMDSAYLKFFVRFWLTYDLEETPPAYIWFSFSTISGLQWLQWQYYTGVYVLGRQIIAFDCYRDLQGCLTGKIMKLYHSKV